MHASHVTDALFCYQGMVADGARGRTPVLVIWVGIDLLVTARLRAEIRLAVESNEQCGEVWIVFPAHRLGEASALLEDDQLSRFSSDVGVTYRLVSVDGTGAWSEVLCIGSDAERLDSRRIPELGITLGQQGLRQIFRDTDALSFSGTGFHYSKPNRAHTNYFLRAAETATRGLHASFVAACLLSVVPETPLRILSDTAGIHPILFHLRSLFYALRGASPIQVDSFGGYESFALWASRISTEDLVVISSSTSGALAEKIVRALKDESGEPSGTPVSLEGQEAPETVAIEDMVGVDLPRLVTLFYLGETSPTPKDASRVLCDLTYREDGDFSLSGVLSAHVEHLDSPGEASDSSSLCEQRVPLLQLEGDSFLPRPDGLHLRMVTLKVLDKGHIDATSKRPLKRQIDFFRDFYGLDAVHMRADDKDDLHSSRRQFRTSIAHLLTDSEPLGAEVRAELLRIRDDLAARLGDRKISAFVATEDLDSSALAKWLAEQTFGGAADAPAPRVYSRKGLAAQPTDLQSFLESMPTGSLVVGVSSVVSTGRALLELSRSFRVVPDGVKTGYLAAIGHPPSLSAWQILLNSLRWPGLDSNSYLEYGWLLERDPMEIRAETAWTAERRLAAELVSSTPSGSLESLAAQSRGREIEANPIGARRLFVAPSYSGVSDAELRPINRRFIVWDFDHAQRERRDSSDHEASQVEVFISMSHMLHRSRFAAIQTKTGRLSSRLPYFVLDPANFDRYNDPQIQASILRAAHPGELDYRLDEDGSRAMTEIVLHSLANLDGEAGATAAEFVIALTIGLDPGTRSGLRLRPDNIRAVAQTAGRIAASGDRKIGPYMRGLIGLLLAKAPSTASAAN